MRALLRAVARILPPVFVLFLFVDLLMNPNIPRLGSSTAGSGQVLLPPEAARELLAESHRLLQSGRDEEALKPALRLYNAYPENHIYSQTLAEIYHRRGRFREEAEYWEKFLQYAPLPLEGCPQIGQAYWAQQRYREAIGAFERCLAFDTDDTDSNFFLAHAFEMNGDLARAAEIYGKFVARHPTTTDCSIGLARVEARQNRLEEARKRIDNVLGQHPNNVDALLVAGIVAWRESKPEQARAYLEKGMALTNGYADYHYVLGRIDESQGRRNEALVRYARALELQPDYEEVARRYQALAGRRR